MSIYIEYTKKTTKPSPNAPVPRAVLSPSAPAPWPHWAWGAGLVVSDPKKWRVTYDYLTLMWHLCMSNNDMSMFSETDNVCYYNWHINMDTFNVCYYNCPCLSIIIIQKGLTCAFRWSKTPWQKAVDHQSKAINPLVISYIATENGPFMVDLPIINCDVP